MYRLDDDQVLRVASLEAFSWLEHGFGTKNCHNWPPEVERATLKQIHSTRAMVARHAGILGEGDALVTGQPGLFVTVKTADCTPVLLVDAKRRVVAAIHAGWRGTAGNIVSTTIDTMVSEFHTNPGDVWAAIGPAIGKCCYEVGGDVARQFTRWLPELAGAGDGTLLDVAEVNRRQLMLAGIPDSQIAASVGQCTRCEAALLHSFRRDKDLAGRMYSGIRIQMG
jgi:YfiH family protein